MNYIKTYDTIIEASILTGVSMSGISDVCRGEVKTSGDYLWKFNKEKI